MVKPILTTQDNIRDNMGICFYMIHENEQATECILNVLTELSLSLQLTRTLAIKGQKLFWRKLPGFKQSNCIPHNHDNRW